MNKAAKNRKNGESDKTANDAFNRETSETDFLIVGIGASAGGVKALKEFFQAVQGEIRSNFYR